MFKMLIENIKGDNLNMIEKLLEFQNYLVRNGRTLSTAKAYVFQVKQLLTACPEITQATVDDYLTKRVTEAEGTYMNLSINALRPYFAYTEQNIILPKYAKPKHKKIQSLTMDFVEKQMLPAIECLNFQNPYKVKAVVYLMSYTGMRKCEVPLLTRDKMDLVNLRLTVYLKKTKKDHIFIFPKKVARVIKDYFDTEPETKNAFNIGEQGVNGIFIKLKSYFKGQVNLFPHLMKKTAVTHLHKLGYSMKEIAVMVGISVKTIDDHYLDVDIDTIQKSGRMK